jgi:glycosyltransferase involved in cell wall biosynthesis
VKILHVITTIEKGGAENQLVVLARQQIASGHEVHVLFLKGRNELVHQFSVAGVKVIEILRNLTFAQQLKAIPGLRRHDFDVIHGHLPRAELYAMFLKKSFSKFVISKHNTELFFPKAPRVVSRLIAWIVYLRANQVICISHAVKDFLVDNSELPERSYKIQVVYYGYASENNSKHGETKLSDRIIIGCVARLTPQKDLRTLIEAMNLVKGSYPRILLKIYGEGPDKCELHNLIKRLNLENVVCLEGKTLDVHAKMREMDLFVLPSKYEGFGLVLLEAMSESIPIVAAANSAIVEVLTPEYPFLFETSNVQNLSEKILGMLGLKNKSQILEFLDSRLAFFDVVTMEKKIWSVYEA